MNDRMKKAQAASSKQQAEGLHHPI